MSTIIKRSALLFHSAEQMFELVNDIASYPKFIEHCVGSAIVQADADAVRATLSLRRAGVALSFTTDNRLYRAAADAVSKIEMTLVEGPFSGLSGLWQFTPLREGACKASLYLEFQMQNALASKLAGDLLESMANTLVDAFSRRADQLY